MRQNKHVKILVNHEHVKFFFVKNFLSHEKRNKSDHAMDGAHHVTARNDTGKYAGNDQKTPPSSQKKVFHVAKER